MKKLIFIYILVIVSISDLFSQDLKYVISDFSDYRTIGRNSICKLKIRFTGAIIQRAIGVKLDTLYEVTDNLGENLINKKYLNSISTDFALKKDNSDKYELEFRLNSPNRSASSITNIKGSIAIYDPSNDPSSSKLVKGFITNPNTFLMNKSEFEVMILNKESYLKLRQEDKDKINQKLKTLTEVNGDSANIKRIIDSFYDYSWYESASNYVNFYVSDPAKSLIDIEFYDENNKIMSTTSKIQMNNYYTYGFNKPITKEWSILIQMKTSKSIIKMPFDFSNIKLP